MNRVQAGFANVGRMVESTEEAWFPMVSSMSENYQHIPCIQKEREREGERERERQRDRETERQRDKETKR